MPDNFRMYQLECVGCRIRYDDDGLRLRCDRPRCASLLRTVYRNPHFLSTSVTTGIFRYAGWLPVRRTLGETAGSVCYQATRLGRAVGLESLWVSFNGCWPRHGADLPTDTFKDLEAATVLARLPVNPPVLVVASAGNTAAAFAAACSRYGRACILIVPAWALDRLRVADRDTGRVRVVAVDSPGTYDDAITLAGALGELDGFQGEGGFRNVARRDGLGTCLLTAFEAMGRLPGTYVQAVGSGAGSLATYEAARRLRLAGHTDDPLPKLLLCQNLPYAPMYAAWRGDARPATYCGPESVAARELTTNDPPLQLAGGVREALRHSGGDVVAAANGDALRAMQLFRDVENIDIEPAAGVALACLAAAVQAGRVARDEPVLINVTGGGRSLRQVPDAWSADMWIDPSDISEPAKLPQTALRVADLVA